MWTLHDSDKSGTFSGFELRNCLESAGYQLNNRVLNILMHRYGNRNGEIKFDDFIMCACKVKTMIGKFVQSKFEFIADFSFFQTFSLGKTKLEWTRPLSTSKNGWNALFILKTISFFTLKLLVLC